MDVISNILVVGFNANDVIFSFDFVIKKSFVFFDVVVKILKLPHRNPQISRNSMIFLKINDKITKVFQMCHIFDFVIQLRHFFKQLSLNRKSNLTKGSAGSDGDIGARCIQYTF